MLERIPIKYKIYLLVFVNQSIDIFHSEKDKNKFWHILSVLTDVEQRYQEVGVNALRILDTAISVNTSTLAIEAARVEEWQDALKHELIDLLDEIQSHSCRLVTSRTWWTWWTNRHSMDIHRFHRSTGCRFNSAVYYQPLYHHPH